MKKFFFGIALITHLSGILFAEYPRLLIKLPTRSRPEKFFKTLDTFYEKLSNKVPYHFLISCDLDDKSMNQDKIKEMLREYPNLSFYFGHHDSKVAAYNADMESHNDFDVVLVVSDDMEPVVDGYDQIIMDRFLKEFPDLDGVLNFNDGHASAEKCNTMPIIGRTFYERFGYIYQPLYKSLFCDSELTLVSRMLAKEAIYDDVIVRHNHPIFDANPSWDQLYQRNNAFWDVDQKTFVHRRYNNFEITDSMMQKIFTKDWSILICTLEKRAKSFNFIYNKLKKQINDAGLTDKIEVLYLKDDGQASVGYKRNELMKKSKGLYTCFIDDDDDVHDNYIQMIHEKLKMNPDCVSLKGVITFNGQSPQLFIHSLKYTDYFEKDSTYYRPPNHLNVIKRCFGIQCFFPEKNFGEDAIWSLDLLKLGLVKKEEEITQPYYFYLFNSVKSKFRQTATMTQD